MKRVIRCTKFYLRRIRGLWVIQISMLNIWTGGGAIELILGTPMLVRSLVMTLTTKLSKIIGIYVYFFYLKPIGGAVPNYGMDPQIMVLMKHSKFRFDWSKFGSDNRLFVIHNLITFEQRWIKKIGSVISVQLSPKIIWANFGKNWLNFQGGVAKIHNTVLFKMVATVMGGVLL